MRPIAVDFESGSARTRSTSRLKAAAGVGAVSVCVIGGEAGAEGAGT